MEQQIQQVIHGHGNESESATAAVLAAVRQGALNVLGLVGLLQRPLTDEVDHEGRARAVQLLSQVAAEAPEALKAGDVGVLAEFLGGKLSDWRAVTSAVPGCCALLSRYKQPALAPLPVADAVKLVAKVAAVHVQGLDYKGRLACYELLLELLQGPFAVPAALAGTDLVLCTVVSMENEADPRSLLVALQCVEAVAKLYQEQPELSSVSHLQDNLEDLFDTCVAPYFPIVFNVPKNDPRGISRQMVLQRVIAAMASCRDFAPLAIPVMSEKLGSNLRQAKEDTLTALPVCLKAWGPAAVKPHLQAVWLMLKSELMAPAALDEATIASEQLTSKRELATAAAGALQHSVAALGPGLLDQQVLNDVAVEDLLQYLGLVNPPWSQAAAAAGAGAEGGVGAAGRQQDSWHLPSRAQKRLACIAACVAAVAAVGGACCDSASAAVLTPAVTAVLQDTAGLSGAGSHDAAAAGAAAASVRPLRPLQANCGVLVVLHQTLQAVAAAESAPGLALSAADVGAYAALTVLMPQVVEVLSRLQQVIDLTQQQQHQQHQQQVSADVNGGMTGLQISQHEEALQCEQLQLCLLLLWQDLLSLPPSISQLQQQQLKAAAQQLMHHALHGTDTATQLELAPGTTASQQHAAAKGLTLLASWPDASVPVNMAAAGRVDHDNAVNMQALGGCAGVLLQLLKGPSSDAAAVVMRSRAQDLLAQLAGSSAAGAWQVLRWLEPLVLQQVQHNDWEELAATLPILHSSCLPSLPPDLPPPQSAAAAEFVASLMTAWQQHPAGTSGSHATLRHGDSSSNELQQGAQHALLHSCLLVAQLSAKCSLTDQRQLLLPTCAWVMQAAAAAGDAESQAAASSGMEASTDSPPGPVCIALAGLAGGQPGLLTGASVLDLLRAAATLASKTDTSSSSVLTGTAAAVVVAGIVNKTLGLHHQAQRQPGGGDVGPTAAAVQPEELLQAVLPLLTRPVKHWLQQQQQQLEQCRSVVPSSASAAWGLQVLSWLARGLAMQRHDCWRDILSGCVVPVLLTPRQEQQAGVHAAPATAGDARGATGIGAPGTKAAAAQLHYAAADFCSVLVAPTQQSRHHKVVSSGSSGSSGSSAQCCVEATSLGQKLSCHWMARPLWQQKAFVLALEMLQASAAPADSPSLSAGPQLQQQEGVWLALASLVSAAPTLLSADGQQHSVLLLQCLVQLSAIWEEPAHRAEQSRTAQANSDAAGAPPLGALGNSSSSHAVDLQTGAQTVRLLQLLHRCLLLLGETMSGGGDAAAATQLGPQAEVLVTTLCRLARLQLSSRGVVLQQEAQQEQRLQLVRLAASVREVGLMCLTGCMALPYHLLHPYRSQVLAAVTAALDDDKRAVRRAAVVCRSAWSTS